MTRREINDEYFAWLSNTVCENRYAKQISYCRLLTYLHNTDFRYSIPMDENRAEEGINLRYRFAMTNGYEQCIDWVLTALGGPCSVLELMVALALYCEENIMDDPSVGNRTGQWFWGMVTNLGLGSMIDSHYDEAAVEEIVTRFMDRKYSPNGKGGLFTVRNCDCDLRDVEIWHQMCWYLDTLI